MTPGEAGKALGNKIAQNLGVIEKATIDIKDSRGGKTPTIKRYTVQFNPSSISLRGRGQGFMPVLTYGQNGETVKPPKQSVRITMSVRLVVDQVSNADAFMEDKLNLSPTQLGQNIAGAVMTGLGKKQVTVQQTVEGFIAALRSPYTRQVGFHWGSMNYVGILNNVSAQYVMFNLQGQPIRAYINLSILCMHDDPAPNSLGPWEEAYKKAFSGDELDTVKGGSQLATNLINLG
ncbi:MAG: hypothetical protein K6A92_06090 [Lachnospiraceae bacterium]|nr:hypothetical protein [Lachnospiraceae bacterium]